MLKWSVASRPSPYASAALLHEQILFSEKFPKGMQARQAYFVPHFVFAIRHLCARLFENLNGRARPIHWHRFVLCAMRDKYSFALQRTLCGQVLHARGDEPSQNAQFADSIWIEECKNTGKRRALTEPYYIGRLRGVQPSRGLILVNVADQSFGRGPQFFEAGPTRI